MTSTAQAFVANVTEEFRRLSIAYNRAEWDAATEGTDAAIARQTEADAALMRYWADADRFAQIKALREQGTDDPLLRRQLERLYLEAAKAQQDEATIEKLTRLEAEVRKAYYNFRAQLNGRNVSDNELDQILEESTDSAQVREAWQASKLVGREVADVIRELAHTRNQAAQAQGYRDHFERSLTLDEIDEGELLELFSELEGSTAEPYAELKAEIDRTRAERFEIEPSQLRPWHYGDRFFQRAPSLGSIDLDAPFKGEDPIELGLKTYDAWGLEVHDILDRSDLYAREGKNQHAFCIDIDREGDVRTLNNLEPNRRWTKTLLHELGHAAYDKYIDRELPWLLREPPHILSTEAIAILMESAIVDPQWMVEVLDVPAGDAGAFAAAARARRRAESLVFTRWVLVMTHFERALYEDPARDLDSLWWELKERYQDLTKPAGRAEPDWAAKYHVALAPVYYHNYELGHLFRAQLHERLTEDVGGLVLQPEVGAWLRQRVFQPGSSMPWSEHIVAATGEPLSPRAFVAELG